MRVNGTTTRWRASANSKARLMLAMVKNGMSTPGKSRTASLTAWVTSSKVTQNTVATSSMAFKKEWAATRKETSRTVESAREGSGTASANASGTGVQKVKSIRATMLSISEKATGRKQRLAVSLSKATTGMT